MAIPLHHTSRFVDSFTDTDQLDDWLSRPPRSLIEMMGRLEGDVMVLGAGGKMGPTLTRMARRAADEAGVERRVIGVSRFSDDPQRRRLESWGVETIRGDLLDPACLPSLPDAALIVYMAGMKFGASADRSRTWAMNTLLPGAVAQRFADSRIAAFSTGNVYGRQPLTEGGSIEGDEPDPEGEYAMSCLGRERAMEHVSRTRGTPVSLLRLNYACETRYGVLVDLARKVQAQQPIDLSMGMVNVIWQGDANAMALLSLERAAAPPFVVNLAGPEQLSVRRICEQLGELLDKQPRFEGEESTRAMLSNGQRGHELFGYPDVPLGVLLKWVARWVRAGGEMLDKPTKFEVKDGKF